MSLLPSKNGFRGEYLARYIMSRFAFISESSVGEDYAIDFYCGLVKNCMVEEFVDYDKPFLLQIKTKTKKELKQGRKNIIYDSPEKLSTLYGLEIPFFVGFLDLKEQTLDIHSTSSMWYPYILLGVDNISQVSLKFRKDDDLSTQIGLPKDYQPKGKGKKRWQVDLGLPVITLKLSELENNSIDVEKIRSILSEIIDIDFETIVSKRLGLAYYRWIYEYETNRPETFKCGYKFVNKGDNSSFNKNSKDMINAMHPYLVSLALSLKNELDFETYDKVRKITELIDPNVRYKDVESKFGEIYNSGVAYEQILYIPEPTTGYTHTVINNSPLQKITERRATNNKTKKKNKRLK